MRLKVCKFAAAMIWLLWTIGAGCRPAAAPVEPVAATSSAAITPASTVSATPTAVPVTSSPIPTATVTPPPPAVPPTVTPSPTPTATPHPLEFITLAALRGRSFTGGAIKLLSIMEETEGYTRYYIAYPSGELTITGTLNQPAGAGPFPVLILVHGYADRGDYYAGLDTWQAADYFARRGYMVLAPDLRSWGQADTGLSLFHIGLTIDILHLIGALPSLPAADPARLGLWGHSMGGGIITKVLTIDPRVDAAVLHAPNSADDADLIARWGPGCLPGQSLAEGDMCNPGEVIPADTPPALVAAYLAAAADPAFIMEVAPYYHLERIGAPVQIHIGNADGERLTQTPPEWSAKLFASLQAAGKEAAFFEYPGEGHYFSGESWALMMERAVTFFDLHLAPQAN